LNQFNTTYNIWI